MFGLYGNSYALDNMYDLGYGNISYGGLYSGLNGFYHGSAARYYW